MQHAQDDAHMGAQMRMAEDEAKKVIAVIIYKATQAGVNLGKDSNPAHGDWANLRTLLMTQPYTAQGLAHDKFARSEDRRVGEGGLTRNQLAGYLGDIHVQTA